MTKMTKILGILLAVCFVLSVTAAAASAGAADGNKNTKNNEFKFMGKNIKSHSNSEKSLKQDGGRNAHLWNNKLWMWVWVPTHYEKKVIKTVKIVKVHGHKKTVVVKKVVNVCIPGHWELKFFKFNQIFKCNTGKC